MTAATCASLRPFGTRSTRSINASCNVSGTLAAPICAGCSKPLFCGATCRGALMMLVVSSSMNSGTPSAFSIIASKVCCARLPSLRSSLIIFVTSLRDKRVSECNVTLAWADQL